MPENPVIQTNEVDLIDAINQSHASDQPVFTLLKTDERVIARVTDGIYRQPSSALRELISNSYDADATRVVIKTDAPRFSRISIEDNGHGMSPETVAHMLMHIGGSAKRQNVGKELGITAEDNLLHSPGGRRLIGKIGIGIFSVAQLTYHFQIITKTRGDNYRTVATVRLKQYSDDTPNSNDEGQKYESGKVTIWREKATDVDTHGTTIVLVDIRPQARDTLQSKEIWAAIEHSEQNITAEEEALLPPKYHVGKYNESKSELRESDGETTALPWLMSDNPKDAFAKLVNSVWDELNFSEPNPKLDKLFDYYLQMIWSISLSVPLPYVEGHLFDMELDSWSSPYLVSNEKKGAAKEVNTYSKPVRETLDLTEAKRPYDFDVYIDDLQLFRPIKYKGLPTASHALKQPLILIGKCKEKFIKVPKELSGGPISFEAYLFWTPKVAPTEHRGSLIRINGASGTLFDPTFMRYQVSEQTRLKQITCEIFIHEGFDSALNIDRESFNFAHPHAVYLTRWLHNALRQLATTQKRLAGEIRTEQRDEQKASQATEIQTIALNVWKQETKDEFSSPPVVLTNKDARSEVKADIIIETPADKDSGRTGKAKSAHEQILSEKIKAITQILASFGVLEPLTAQQQSRLLKAIYNVLKAAE